jgi:hypothetical protein
MRGWVREKLAQARRCESCVFESTHPPWRAEGFASVIIELTHFALGVVAK